ncbi:MAG: 16S rRNA (guanine(527)-N(7))-methyltransferase RsmG [Sphaerochaetaceae bacterium]|jgi:16S rRNA (guanine527-N7)-methyltransferase|nr:16S rRNA (guanine(527)-N(7))-methyltransferase RsmG [Candidatus Cloacimonadota bacterium]
MEELKKFAKGLSELKIEFDSEQFRQIETFINEIYLFNPTHKLVNATGQQLIIKHFLDSIAPYYILKGLFANYDENQIICDLGSGGGFPAVVLAIAFKKRHFVLIERSEKRAQFLQSCITLCNLNNRVEVINRDFTQIKNRYKIVTFRAVSPLSSIMGLISPILAEGGVVCAYKGKSNNVQKEVEALNLSDKQHKWRVEIEEIEVPFLDSERSLVILKKDN